VHRTVADLVVQVYICVFFRVFMYICYHCSYLCMHVCLKSRCKTEMELIYTKCGVRRIFVVALERLAQDRELQTAAVEGAATFVFGGDYKSL